MSNPSTISRFADYCKRHGFRATVRRAALAAKQAVFSNRMVVFYCDLAKQAAPPTNLPDSLRLERLGNYSDLSSHDLQEMTSFWNPKQAHRDILERFDRGASLWLIKCENRLAGYSWTIRGETIAPYYFPMTKDDVQLFDFYVFPKFRGRAILWFLIIHILHNLADEGAARVFGDVAEWNQASLSFYKTTPFQRLGLTRKFTIWGHTFVWWAEKAGPQQKLKVTRPTGEPAGVKPSTSFSGLKIEKSR